MIQQTVLSFQGVSRAARRPYESGLAQASFSLRAGELVLISLETGAGRSPLADIAEGLVEPEEGLVKFRGRDWRTMDPAAGAAARGTIGRVFETPGWVSNLNVDKNITLSQRHHTLRPEAEIYREAEKWGGLFDLPKLPAGRPARFSRSVRRRAEWTRAFLGSPALIILEQPLRGVYNESLPGLARGVEEARRRGAAVLWITGDSRSSRPGVLNPSQRYQLKNTELFSVSG